MPNNSVVSKASLIAGDLAAKMGFLFVDAELANEGGAAFLRIFIDLPNGNISLNQLESFHKALNKEVDSLAYDYLEVSSPGIDRPLKTQQDFDRMLGRPIDLKLYKAVDGAKLFSGELVRHDENTLTILLNGEEAQFEKGAIAKATPAIIPEQQAFDHLEEEPPT